MSHPIKQFLRSGLVLAVSIVTTVALTLSAAAGSSPTAAKTALRVTWQSRLTLWNHLGSEDQVTHSRVGPNLSLRYLAPGCWDTSEPAFVPGDKRRGITIGSAQSGAGGRICNAIITEANTLYTADHGTIQLAFKVKQLAVPYEHGVYRIYDGGYGPEVGGPALWVYTDNVHPGALLYFVLGAGTSQSVYATSVVTGDPWVDIGDRLKTWTDAVIMWDRSGIDGSGDTMRLYLNGTLVASATANTWSSEVGQYVDIAGGNDGGIAHKFVVDELKVWNGITFEPLESSMHS